MVIPIAFGDKTSRKRVAMNLTLGEITTNGFAGTASMFGTASTGKTSGNRESLICVSSVDSNSGMPF